MTPLLWVAAYLAVGAFWAGYVEEEELGYLLLVVVAWPLIPAHELGGWLARRRS